MRPKREKKEGGLKKKKERVEGWQWESQCNFCFEGLSGRVESKKGRDEWRGCGRAVGGGGRRKGVKPVYLWEESDSRLPANNPLRLSAFSPRLPEPLPLKFLSFTPCFFSFPARSARQLLQIYCNSPSSLCFSSPPRQNMLKKKRQEKQKPPPSSFLLFKPAAPLKRSPVTPLFRGDISKKAKHPSFRPKKREKKRITEEKKPVSRWMARVPACVRALLFDSARGPPVSTSGRRSESCHSSRHSSRGGV